MDAEDTTRTLSNREKVLAYLREHGSATNQRLRGIGGARAMGRVNELVKAGYPITVRKIKGAEWEVRWNAPALARDAGTRVNQKPLPMLPF
jgi:proline dehydrogenase